MLGKLTLLGYLAALPANAAPKHDINNWVQQAKADPAYRKSGIPRKILLTDDFSSDNLPTFMQLDDRAFNKLSFISMITQHDARQTLQINDPPRPGTDEESRIFSALTLLGSDLILVGKYDGKPWRVLGLNKNRPVVIAQAPGPHGVGTNQNSLIKWLLRNLGYDAVVIAVDKNRILVGGMAEQLTAITKGTVLRRSADTFKISMPPEKTLVSIQKVAVEGAFAEFRIITNEAKDPKNPKDAEDSEEEIEIPIGSKVIFPDAP